MDLGPCWDFFLPNGSTGVSKIIQKWKFSFGVQMHARSTSSVTKHNSVRCMLDILESSSFECSIWGLSSLPTSATSLIATAAAYVIGGEMGGGDVNIIPNCPSVDATTTDCTYCFRVNGDASQSPTTHRRGHCFQGQFHLQATQSLFPPTLQGDCPMGDSLGTPF